MDKVRANRIVAKALQIRKRYLNAGPQIPICPYVLAEAMELDLRFVNIPSFEGMYVANEQLILISAERPEGRKRFTCAHELGHHVLGHGTVIDEIIEHGSDKEIEKEADLFAAILLMPSSAVTATLNKYGVKAENLTKADVYILSKYFGVSYKAFITQLCFNLKIINRETYLKLDEANLKSIRNKLCPVDSKGQILKVGYWWQSKAIDVEVGDLIISDSQLQVDGPNIIQERKAGSSQFFEAISPGITRLYDENEWSSYLKVSPKKFNGMFQYKYEEDAE